jgi:septal ring factor EnvC (AmiA/AmiB activator)
MKRKAVKSVLICALLSVLVSDMSSDVSKKSDELNKVRSDIDTAKQTVLRLSEEKNKLQAQLAGIEKRYGETAALVKTLSVQIAKQQRDVQQLSQQTQQHQSELVQQQQELAGQIRAAYALGQREQLKLWLNQQQPAVSSRMMVYYRYLNAARLAKIAYTENTLQQITNLQEQQTLEQNVLSQTQQQQQQQQQLLTSLKKERDVLLAQLSHEVSSHQQQLARLQESENKLENLISSLQSSQQALIVVDNDKPITAIQENKPAIEKPAFSTFFSKAPTDFASQKGSLPWPIQGKLIQKFGSPRGEGQWDGVLIDTDEGAEIHAVSSGKIVYANTLGGYGLLLIIDHGNEYMSLYAFNQSIYKKEGDSVSAGDVIASVGQSGGRSQTGLYFGIRKKNVPLDPQLWCRN